MIALAADHVERSECRDDVTQHGAVDQIRETLRDGEARWTDPNAPRRTGSIGHEVEAELAIAAFGVRVDLALRDLAALHDQLEVLDGSFDRRVNVLLRGKDDTRIVDIDRTLVRHAV